MPPTDNPSPSCCAQNTIRKNNNPWRLPDMDDGNHRNNGASSVTMISPNEAAYAKARFRAVVSALRDYFIKHASVN